MARSEDEARGLPPNPHRKSERFVGLAAITIVIAVFASGIWIAGSTAWNSVHSSLSYPSYHFAQLRYERTIDNTTYLIWVGMNFVGDGPIVAGQPLNLAHLQVTGLFPQPTSRIYFRIVMPNVHPLWPTLNQTVEEPDRDVGYLFENVGSGAFVNPGTVNFSGLLDVWVGTTRYAFRSPQDVSPTNLTVLVADAWSEYNARRMTAAIAVLAFLFPAVPIAIKASWDMLKPLGLWLGSKLSNSRSSPKEFAGDLDPAEQRQR